MARITFKAKPRDIWNATGETVEFRTIPVPVLKRSHCDMAAFRCHKKYGGFANSDLFPAMLARIRRDIAGPYGELRLDRLPAGVSVDLSGFLATVTIDV